MQTIVLSGRIGGDAALRTTQGGDSVTSFNLAVDQGYGDRKKTNWFRVSIWGKKGAGAAPYLLKSGQITVVGELEIGEYNGSPQYDVRANDFTLPAKGSGQSGGGSTQRSSGNRNDNYSQMNDAGQHGDDLDEDLIPW